jgi:hypothetical protein
MRAGRTRIRVFDNRFVRFAPKSTVSPFCARLADPTVRTLGSRKGARKKGEKKGDAALSPKRAASPSFSTEPHGDISNLSQPVVNQRDPRGRRRDARVVLREPNHDQIGASSGSQRTTRESAPPQNPATAHQATPRSQGRTGIRRVNRTPFTATGSAIRSSNLFLPTKSSGPFSYPLFNPHHPRGTVLEAVRRVNHCHLLSSHCYVSLEPP